MIFVVMILTSGSIPCSFNSTFSSVQIGNNRSDTLSPSRNAVIDTIRLKDKRLQTAYLKLGTRHFIILSQDPQKNKVLSSSFWIRDTKIITHNGEKVFETTQHWYGNDSTDYRMIKSLNRVTDFAPIFFSETTHNRVKAYDWFSGKIKGSDTVTNNTKADFSLTFDEPNFNWNLDIETFEMLPLAQGRVFAINFYDAGLDPPELIYKVTGSEPINTYNGNSIDCWKLSTEGLHDGNIYSETFWISKKYHEFLREEDFFNGMYRYKIALPASTFNVLKRFHNYQLSGSNEN